MQSGDCFLLCSDGVLEAWSDADLETLFDQVSEPHQALELINEHCLNNSRDNFTAICVKAEVSGTPPLHKEKRIPQGFDKITNKPKKIAPNKKAGVRGRLIVVFMLITLLLCGGVYYMFFYSKPKDSSAKEKDKKIMDNPVKKTNKPNDKKPPSN